MLSFYREERCNQYAEPYTCPSAYLVAKWADRFVLYPYYAFFINDILWKFCYIKLLSHSSHSMKFSLLMLPICLSLGAANLGINSAKYLLKIGQEYVIIRLFNMNRIVLIGHKNSVSCWFSAKHQEHKKRRIVVMSVVCQSDKFLPSLLYFFLFYFGFSKQFVLINFKKIGLYQ